MRYPVAHRMISLALLYGLCVPAFALPTADALRSALAQDPVLTAASAQQQAAEQAAAVQAGSPYEWTANISTQQRRSDGNPSSQEWNAALEHGLRWPGKARLDRQLADLARQEASLRYGLAREESAGELLNLWLAWAKASARAELLTRQLELSNTNLASVRQRIHSGDAAVQEETLATAELASLASQHSSAGLAVRQAEADLQSRFPSLMLTDATVPTPTSPTGNASEWRQRILAVSPRLALARLQVQQARLQAERAAVDKTPDPTVGVFTASEARNTERIVGLSVSLPLSGQRRRQQAAQAQAEAQAVDLASRSETRRLETAASQAWPNAESQVRVWQLAADSAKAQAVAAERGQKGFTLGEIGLPELLLLRRQAITAADAELEARVSSWQAIYSLEIAAQRGWLATENTPLSDATQAP